VTSDPVPLDDAILEPFDPRRLGFSVPPGDEVVPLVDSDDAVVGVKRRSHIEPHDVTRVANAFVQRPDGRVWVPTRSPNRRRFPSSLDFSIGGLVRHGEEYRAALAREAAEHTGLDVAALTAQEVARLAPDDGVSSFMAVFIVRTARVDDWDRDAYSEARWLTAGQLAAELDAGTAAKPDLRPALARLRAALEC
jgi:isopentenyl-diphosphate delta-isomerase